MLLLGYEQQWINGVWAILGAQSTVGQSDAGIKCGVVVRLVFKESPINQREREWQSDELSCYDEKENRNHTNSVVPYCRLWLLRLPMILPPGGISRQKTLLVYSSRAQRTWGTTVWLCLLVELWFPEPHIDDSRALSPVLRPPSPCSTLHPSTFPGASIPSTSSLATQALLGLLSCEHALCGPQRAQTTVVCESRGEDRVEHGKRHWQTGGGTISFPHSAWSQSDNIPYT